LVLALGLVVIDRILMAWRWIALLDRDAGPLPPSSRLMRIFFVSTFLSIFLPSGLGGDAVRAWSLSRENVQGSRALASVVMDRLLGTISLVLLAAVGLFTAVSVIPVAVLAVAVGAAAIACIAALAVVYSHGLERVLQQASTRLPPRLATPASRMVVALRAYSRRHGALLLVLLGSIVVNIVRVLQVYVLGVALGIEAPFFAYAAFVPIIVLVMQLPITIFGLGTTQLAFWWFFGQVGVAEAEAVALSVLFLGLGLVGALPGGIFYLIKPGRDSASAPVL
jgi:uncharacterized protein (TIRG00374 family)